MNRFARVFIPSALFLLLPLAALADEMVSLKVGYLTLAPQGKFTASEDGVGTEIDLEDDLDFDDSEELMVEAAVQLGPFRLAAGYTPLDFSGTSTLTRSFTFNGQTYSAGETVKGDIDLDLYEIGLTWHLINFDDLPVRLQLGPELAVKVVDGDLRVASKTNPLLTEEVSGTAALPTIGARARVGISDFVGLIGRVGWAGYGDNHFLDADGQLEFSPIPLLGVFAGYRYLDIDVDESDIFIDANFSGPYGGAFVRF